VEAVVEGVVGDEDVVVAEVVAEAAGDRLLRGKFMTTPKRKTKNLQMRKMMALLMTTSEKTVALEFDQQPPKITALG
jgi:hypothetical protein